MSILHIFKNTSEKFAEPYIEFINKNFKSNSHIFYYMGKDIRKIRKNHNNLHFSSSFGNISLIKTMNKSEKIFLHSLFSFQLVLLLAMQPWLFKKCYWAIWGADLYYHIQSKKTIKFFIYEFLRYFVIKNINGLVTHVKGDYELACKWYKTRGKYYYCFMYPSNLYKEINIKNLSKNKTKVIQLGNSSDPNNNHIEVLDRLKKYKNSDIKILCPLSYGDVNYKQKITLYGNNIFGDRFKPIVEFMSFDNYINLLSQIDIAIFNHKRQQGMSNIISLLGMGKKVYIRDDVSTWRFLKNLDIEIFNSKKGFEDLFEELSEENKNKNIEIVKKVFSEKKLIEDLNSLFA